MTYECCSLFVISGSFVALIRVGDYVVYSWCIVCCLFVSLLVINSPFSSVLHSF